MKLSFHGAAKTVTGSKHLLTLDNGVKILLDCGMFQSMGAQTFQLNSEFGFDPADIKYLILTHAHIDHSGLIPKLVKEGFTGKILCTPATQHLTEILLHDSAEIQTYETDAINRKRAANGQSPYEPLYDHDDVKNSMELFYTLEYDKWLKIEEGIKLMFTNTGHLIGSAAANIVVKQGRKNIKIHFSGDVGRYQSVLLQPPAAAVPADYIVMESTYGDKHHDIANNNIETLLKWINKTCIDKKGQLIIPAFSVGRTQEVLYALNQLELEKRLPDLNYYVDSPLSMKATEVIKKFKPHFNDKLQKVLEIDDDPFSFKGLKYIETVEDSRRLVEYKEPCVIISASGTADAGRVRHHLLSCIEDEKNSVLLVGYCGINSCGGQLLNGAEEIELFGEMYKVKAETGQLCGMSAHGDAEDLCQFLNNQNSEKVKKVFLVHGEYKTQQEFSARLNNKGFKDVIIPAHNEEFILS